MRVLRYIPLLFLGIITVNAQKKELREASKEYKDFSYVKTAEILVGIANDGYKSKDMFEKLGNSYYFTNKMEEAAKWYGELMAMDETVGDPEYYYRYAQALKSIEKYDESDKWMQKFHENKKDDIRGRAFASTKDYLDKIKSIKSSIELKNLEINSSFSDFGSTQFGKQLVFASAREGSSKYEWNDQPYLDLYIADRVADSTSKIPSYNNVIAFNSEINSKYHESSVAYTPNEKIMFFTRNNFYNKKYKSDANGTNKLKIFRARLQDEGEWGALESVHFNNDNYSVAHPAINVKGTKMYFASDMNGTVGLSDIFVVDLEKDGTLGEPKNLGKAINTEGQETFPYINSKGDLFYSTNGLPGLGGLDVFVIRDFETKFELSQPLVAENIGEPINSPFDDFGYYENLATKDGFISSNRPGGKGDDDIYAFEAIDPRDCKQEITGVVKDKRTQELIPNATVILFDATGKEISSVLVGNDAAFKFEADCGTEYLVRGVKTKYTPDEKRTTMPTTDLKLNEDLELDLSMTLELDPETPDIEIGIDIRQFLGINIIYFDLDKSYIRSPDATADLQKVILFMKTYPTTKVEVRSHTDCRAPDAYNLALSKRRNKATIDYIVAGGIDRSRLIGDGYGETRLVNKCADGVKCTEAEHELNRRSEFILLEK